MRRTTLETRVSTPASVQTHPGPGLSFFLARQTDGCFLPSIQAHNIPHTYLHMYVHMCIFTYIHLHPMDYIAWYDYVWMCVRVFLYIYICICMCACMRSCSWSFIKANIFSATHMLYIFCYTHAIYFLLHTCIYRNEYIFCYTWSVCVSIFICTYAYVCVRSCCWPFIEANILSATHMHKYDSCFLREALLTVA